MSGMDKHLTRQVGAPGPAVIIGNPESIFPRELASYWRSRGLDPVIVTRIWEGDKYLPDGTPVLASRDHESPFLSGQVAILQNLFHEMEREIYAADPDRYERSLREFSSDGYRPSVSQHIAESLSISSFVRSLNPRFVFGQEVFAYGLAAALCFGFPRVLMPWGGDIFYFSETSPIAFAMVKYALNQADYVCPGSEVAVQHIIDRYCVSPSKVEAVSWGVDLDLFSWVEGERRSFLRRKYQINPDALVFINLRRFKPPWGSEAALNAFIEVATDHPLHHFILIGGQGGERHIEQAQARLEKESLTERFTVLSGNIPLSEYAELVSISDISVSLMHSRDMRSQSILQGAASGAAPVLSHQPEYDVMTRNGFSGIFVDPKDHFEVVTALRRYAADPVLRRVTAEQNHEYIKKHEDKRFQMEKLLKRVDPFYSSPDDRNHRHNQGSEQKNGLKPMLISKSDLNSIWLDLETNQWRSPDEIREIQLRRVQALVKHASQNVLFYKTRFREIGFQPEDLRELDDLLKLPVLKKDDVQQSLAKMTAANYSPSDLIRDATGGSTGAPISFYRDQGAHIWLDEAAKRFRRWIGYLPEDKLALIWGADRDIPSEYPPNQRWLNSFSLSPEKIDAFIEELLHFNPRAIRAYASSLYLVSSYLKKKGFTAPYPLASAIESSAEKLWDWQRPVIEEVFGCKVFNMYGSREVPSIGCECDLHHGLHVFSDIRIVEVVRDGQPAQPGTPGSILITDLVNYGMPFIRYEIGDVGVLAGTPCSCGRSFPLLSDIKGRVTSTITLPDGRYVHGEYFTHLFYNQPGIAAFQVRQRRREEIEIYVQPGPGFDPRLIEGLVERAHAHVGPDVRFDWKAVDNIPPAPSGKYHFTISDVPVDLSGDSAGATLSSQSQQGVSPGLHTGRHKPRILMIIDVPDWIFARHSQVLQRYLSDEFDFSVSLMGQPYDETEFDLIYPLEWFLVRPEQIHNPRKYVTGIRSHDSWVNRDFSEFIQYLSTHFLRVHVVSQRLLDIFKPVLPGVVYVTHGVDTDFFTPALSTDQSGRKLRLGWAGNRLKSMYPANKGFHEFIEPLSHLPGVELVFCGYSDRNLSLEEMKDFYESLDAYICASAFEGNNNSLLEAAAMAQAIVTTDNGTVPEYLTDGHSALIVERNLPNFVQAVEFLRDNPEQRVRMGEAARQAVLSAWKWQDRAEDYRRFFREAIEQGLTRSVVQTMPSPSSEKLDSLLRRTDALFTQGDLVAASQVLKQAIEIVPDSPQLILANGNLKLSSGETEAARREFVKAVALSPNYAPAYLNLAAVQYMLGQSEAAVANARRALELEPGNPEARQLLNQMLSERGQKTPGSQPACLLPGEGVTRALPKTVHFLLNDKCNARCIMCGGDYANSKSGRRITFEKFQRMAANLQLERFEMVVLSGAGDPLLNRDLVRIIRYLNEQYPRVKVSITTNGIALSQNLAEKLLSCTIDNINISINAATPLTYKQIMQVDAFERVCQNIHHFVARRAQLRSGPMLRLSSAINRLNIEELPLLIELAHQLGAESVNTMYCRFYPENIRHLNVEAGGYRLQDSDSLFFHQELSDRMVERAEILARQFGIWFSHEPLFKDHAGQRQCVWPETELMVGFDGEVYPCGGAELQFKDKVEGGIYIFGNALKESIDAFWNNETYRALRVSSKQENRYHIRECRSCANLMAPNRMESHIMHWDDLESENPQQPALCLDLAQDSSPAPRSHLASGDSSPLVSVVVATYNRPEMLAGALQSILSQTYPNIEIIVSNDAGQDISAVIEMYNQQGNITYVRHGSNRGLAATRNQALRLAKGKYIAYLDDDDRYYPDHVETLVNFLESAPYQAAYTDAHRAHQQKDEHGQYVVVHKDLPYSEDFDNDRILVSNFIPVLCVMHAKACLDEVGLFDESLLRQEDWELWIRLSRKYEIAHIRTVTCEFSWREDGSSMTSGKRAEWARSAQAIYTKHLHHSQDKPGVLQGQAQMLAMLTEQVSRENGPLPEQGSPSLVESDPPAGERLEEGCRPVEDIKVDIVIPVYGQPQFVKRCVESVLRTTSNVNIFLVDDASPDEPTRRLLEACALQPCITVVRNTQNLGFIGTSRRGADMGKAPFILFLNSDVEALEAGWLEKMIPAEEDVAITGALLLYPPDLPGPLAGRVQHAGVARYCDGRPYHPFLGRPAGLPEACTTRQVNAVTGACLLIRRKVWEELGGWDPRFGRGVFEDVDLCWQARQRGYRVTYQPAAVLYHRESASKEIDGSHNLHLHSPENVEKLLAKWKPVRSDEEIFYGLRVAQKRQKGYYWMQRARKALDRGDRKESFAAVARAIKIAPDLPDALVGYAQILASQGDHISAVGYFEKALELERSNWKLWLRVVDEWAMAGRPDRAAQLLVELKAAFPQDDQVLEREKALADWLPHPATLTPPNEQLSHVRANGTQTSAAISPAETLAQLLDADDLLAALDRYADRLDADLVALIKDNASAARQDGEDELAAGLEELVVVIEEKISAKHSPSPAGRSARTLELLLDAVDLPVALQEHAALLDQDLLALVRANAAAAWSDGDAELAEGLEDLAVYIEQVLSPSIQV